MKKWIVVILAILLTLGAGFAVPILMQSDKGSSIKEAAKSTTSDIKTPVAGSANNATDNVELVTPLASPSAEYKTDVILGIPSPTVLPQKTKDNNVVSSPKPEPTKNKESVSWVDRKIEEHRDEIDDDDLSDFRRIYSSVNIGYIQGLMDEGLDDEEMTQLKTYLRSTLGGDYERAKTLFYQYSHLLSEV
jgi:hypothetical protein